MPPLDLFGFADDDDDDDAAVERYYRETDDGCDATDLLWPFTTLILVLTLLSALGAWAVGWLVYRFS